MIRSRLHVVVKYFLNILFSDTDSIAALFRKYSPCNGNCVKLVCHKYCVSMDGLLFGLSHSFHWVHGADSEFQFDSRFHFFPMFSSLSGAVLSARALALRAECDAAAGGDARVRSEALLDYRFFFIY